jgi:hypothetical protein
MNEAGQSSDIDTNTTGDSRYTSSQLTSAVRKHRNRHQRSDTRRVLNTIRLAKNDKAIVEAYSTALDKRTELGNFTL